MEGRAGGIVGESTGGDLDQEVGLIFIHKRDDAMACIHEVPDLLQRWRPDAEVELLAYLDEYDSQFDDLHLRDLYVQARDASHL